MRMLEQCVDCLSEMSRSGEPYSERRVDVLVDAYLVGFGAETATKRRELARAFRDSTPVSALRERILDRIQREDLR